MSRKIQTHVSDDLSEEIDSAMKRERYSDVAEFTRQCIRSYLKSIESKESKESTKQNGGTS